MSGMASLLHLGGVVCSKCSDRDSHEVRYNTYNCSDNSHIEDFGSQPNFASSGVSGGQMEVR